jgi:hypothetical protein
MKISGFTFIKNAEKLYIPAKESILSILPICDEFIIAIGDNDIGDNTLKIIQSIQSEKIKIIHTKWNTKDYPKNTIFAHQTDIAKQHCKGDWLFYLQCDEAIHQNDLETIKKACDDHLDDKSVDGFLFHYLHFWGDYNHFHNSHSWYKKEIRIIRNLPSIHSWKDAQSFRKFTKWEGGTFNDYTTKKYNAKLNVIELNVHVFHYGYVRPPKLMSTKRKSSSTSYHGKSAKKIISQIAQEYDYGPLNKLKKYQGTHPSVMKEWISKFNWSSQLQYTGNRNKKRNPHKHEKFKYRLLSFIENTFLNGEVIGGFKNYTIIEKSEIREEK